VEQWLNKSLHLWRPVLTRDTTSFERIAAISTAAARAAARSKTFIATVQLEKGREHRCGVR
tara:strand:+ start:4300 stop:4482 length:183 start_codon:yes stop_codon:yes gene_type:complete